MLLTRALPRRQRLLTLARLFKPRAIAGVAADSIDVPDGP
jgi:hypothetical protein